MALTLTKILADQARVFRDCPTETITISGASYQALVENREEGNDFGEGGRTDIKTLRVAIERGSITGNIPVQGTQATYDGATWRIAAVETDDAGSSVHLTLEHTTLR